MATLTDKPCFFYSSFGQAHNRALGEALADLGVPCLNGAETMMSALRNVQNWADRRRNQMPDVPAEITPETLATWAARLAAPMDEHAGLALLANFGVPVAKSLICTSPDELILAVNNLGFPLALKTAAPGIDHKSDLGGVILNLNSFDDLRAAYADLSRRLGPRMIVQKMAEKGVELAFGCVVDPDFGPIVMVSAGGTLVELLDDRQFTRAPFGPVQAKAMIRRLRVARLLDGVRGDAPSDIDAAAQALSAFSQACAGLAGHLAELDVNPVVVTKSGVIAVDALVLPAATKLPAPA